MVYDLLCIFVQTMLILAIAQIGKASSTSSVYAGSKRTFELMVNMIDIRIIICQNPALVKLARWKAWKQRLAWDVMPSSSFAFDLIRIPRMEERFDRLTPRICCEDKHGP